MLSALTGSSTSLVSLLQGGLRSASAKTFGRERNFMNIEIIGFWCRADGRYFGDENNDSTSRGWHHQQHLSDRVCAVSWNNTDADSARHLLPMNVYRLYEQVMLVRRVRKASNEGLSMDWLMPYMTRRRVCRGQILFRKGQPATEMFIVSSGRLRLSEIAVDVLRGGVVGELGLLAPNQRRTQTLKCVEDAEILQIDYDRIKSIYFQNPSFGFYLLRLTSARLFQNIAQLEKELEQRDQEIQRLQAAHASGPNGTFLTRARARPRASA
jgi:CRP-like cAMP-binding protein